jgi:hypothetical protein
MSRMDIYAFKVKTQSWQFPYLLLSVVWIPYMDLILPGDLSESGY